MLCTHSTFVMHSVCALHTLKSTLGGSNKGVVLNDLALIFRFGEIFKRHFKGKFSKSNEHLWWHVNVEIADFQTPTYEWDKGMPIDVLRTGSHPCMLLYVLDELFYVYKGVGVNDMDGQCIVAYEILMVASLCCTEQCGSQKKECNTLGAAYPRVNLSDINGLEHLTWAVYDGVYMTGDLLALTDYHDWECIITGTTLCLIFCGKTNSKHCKPSTIAFLNAEQAMKLAQQQGLLQPGKRRSWATPAAAAGRTPTVLSVVNVPPQAVSSYSKGGVQATSLDYKEDSDGESPFLETSRRIMMRSSPVRTYFNPMWHGEGLQVSTMPLCPPAPTMLNIEQFLGGHPKEGDSTPWLLAYAHTLQHVGEATEGRTWHLSGMRFTPQIFLLVNAFIGETGTELTELDITSCWGQPPEEVLPQKDDGPFVEVIS